MAFEDANQQCKEALGAHKQCAALSEMIRVCADIGPSYVQEAALAAAGTQAVHHSLEETEVTRLLVSAAGVGDILPKIALLHW